MWVLWISTAEFYSWSRVQTLFLTYFLLQFLRYFIFELLEHNLLVQRRFSGAKTIGQPSEVNSKLNLLPRPHPGGPPPPGHGASQGSVNVLYKAVSFPGWLHRSHVEFLVGWEKRGQRLCQFLCSCPLNCYLPSVQVTELLWQRASGLGGWMWEENEGAAKRSPAPHAPPPAICL